MATRILHIIPTLVRGGAEKQLTLLARGLSRDRFDVHVCALTSGGPLMQALIDADIPVTVLNKTWKIDPWAFWQLKRHIQKLAPDIVHTWIFAANCYGRQAARSAGVKHIVAGERCVDDWKVGHELVIDRYLAKYTQRIVTNSSGVRDFYVGRGLPQDKFVVIPNGIHPFQPHSDVTRQQVLTDLGLPEDSRIIAAIGRLWPQKRVKDLIWAADLLKCVRDDTHLLIIGDGPLRWRLERYCRQVQITDKVHFLGQRNDVPRLLPHLDCLWLASGYEGQSNAIMEAMSAAVPVVATDIPGNRDLVQHQKTGYLISLGNRAEIARWTNVLLDDRELAARLGAAGRQRMLQHFSVEGMVQQHADLYRELAGN